MCYQLLADGVMLLHLGFVLFVVFGGLLAFRWRKVVWFHLPAATWGATVEFTGWICPLTPLEVWLRLKGGDSGYGADFIEQYILPVLYPADLTHDVQIVLGSFVVVVNMVVYGWLWRRTFKSLSRSRNPSASELNR
ncbi:MAG: DUF2784 domain-containing protein [Nitrospirales bacterium]|nr:DUF2784 domain-containing protein [Nitrospirales bacterium]